MNLRVALFVSSYWFVCIWTLGEHSLLRASHNRSREHYGSPHRYWLPRLRFFHFLLYLTNSKPLHISVISPCGLYVVLESCQKHCNTTKAYFVSLCPSPKFSNRFVNLQSSFQCNLFAEKHALCITPFPPACPHFSGISAISERVFAFLLSFFSGIRLNQPFGSNQ